MAETVTDREALGRIVRSEWVRWASEQSDPKLSWLVGWDALDAGQREVDMRIGEAVWAAVLMPAMPEERAEGGRLAAEILTDPNYGQWVFQKHPKSDDVGMVLGADGYEAAVVSQAQNHAIWDRDNAEAVVWAMNRLTQLLADSLALARERQRVTVLRKAAFDVLESCVPSPDDIPEAETRLTDRGKERVRALWRAIKDVDPPVTG